MMLFSDIVKVYERLSSTTSLLSKRDFLLEFLKRVDGEEIEVVLRLLDGTIFLEYEEEKLGVNENIILKVLEKVTGLKKERLVESWKKKGDLGEVSEEVLGKKEQKSLFSKKLEVEYVFESLRKVGREGGQGSLERKISLISELLTHSTALEGKYIVKIVLGNLRLGFGRGVLRDALSLVFEVDKNLVEHAYYMVNDFGFVAKLLSQTKQSERENKLRKLSIVLGKPIQVMLFPKVENIQEAFERVGKPALIDFKYDGFRLQAHKKGKEVWLFTRRLENVTKQFPDIKKEVLKFDGDFVIEGEACGIKSGRFVPFQDISQRIKRKYDILETSLDVPMKLFCFDLIYLNGEDHLETAYERRHELLEKLLGNKSERVLIAEFIKSDDEKRALGFRKKAEKEGFEGLMVKDIKAKYRPGLRVGTAVKWKFTPDTLELAIVGAEWGEGRRAGVLSSFYLGALDSKSGEHKLIGKMSTGVKEKDTQKLKAISGNVKKPEGVFNTSEIRGISSRIRKTDVEEGVTYNYLTKLLKKNIIKTEGKTVWLKPSEVVEVGYEEIQKSNKYPSGFALRFPRFIRLRTSERSVKDCDTVERVKKLYNKK